MEDCVLPESLAVAVEEYHNTADETKAKVEPELEVKSRPESEFEFESEVKETLRELCDRCAQHMDHIIVASTVCLVARCTTLQ